MNSSVWINGRLLGTRPYGYSSFEYDLTPYIKTGITKNVIAVKVNNNQPTSRWYSGSGIYRNVWLTITDPVHIAYCGTVVTSYDVSQSSATISVRTTVQNHSSQPRTVSVISDLYDQSWQLVTTDVSAPVSIDAGKDDSSAFIYKLTNPNLWSCNNPYLYHVRIKLVDSCRVLDQFGTTLGIRTFSTSPTTGFWLNGENIKLHGVCMHHDLGSLGSAQNYRALERQVEILKSFGCNAIRTSHNPPAPALLEICDRLGVVVMDEAFDAWERSKKANDYSLYFDTWAKQDVQDWIRRDRNHPCVIMWSIGNEIPEQTTSAGVTTATNLKSWVQLDDPTRPVTQALNSSSMIGPVLDVVGWNYASGGVYDNDHDAQHRTKAPYRKPTLYTRLPAHLQTMELYGRSSLQAFF